MPKKFNGAFRGFCFVEFLTKQDAKNALENLQRVRLYGRPLIIGMSFIILPSFVIFSSIHQFIHLLSSLKNMRRKIVVKKPRFKKHNVIMIQIQYKFESE
jgi:RNA recognition motif-containing protein